MKAYDKNGMAISTEEWRLLFESMDYRRIAWDELPNGCIVSTVWLGIDHRFGLGGPPLIFETMMQEADGWDDECRTATHAQALQAHAAMLEVASRKRWVRLRRFALRLWRLPRQRLARYRFRRM